MHAFAIERLDEEGIVLLMTVTAVLYDPPALEVSDGIGQTGLVALELDDLIYVQPTTLAQLEHNRNRLTTDYFESHHPASLARQCYDEVHDLLDEQMWLLEHLPRDTTGYDSADTMTPGTRVIATNYSWEFTRRGVVVVVVVANDPTRQYHTPSRRVRLDGSPGIATYYRNNLLYEHPTTRHQLMANVAILERIYMQVGWLLLHHETHRLVLNDYMEQLEFDIRVLQHNE